MRVISTFDMSSCRKMMNRDMVCSYGYILAVIPIWK